MSEANDFITFHIQLGIIRQIFGLSNYFLLRSFIMGCWYKTCGLSNLHIPAGTPVYVFVLERRGNGISDACYSTSMFAPLLLPFESEYNDYGGGENSKGVGFPYIMQALKTTW